jgi:hypothetical protein
MNRIPITKIRMQNKCAECNNSDGKLLTCSGCKQIVYCGTQCQLKHWKQSHKFDCKRLATHSLLSDTHETPNLEYDDNYYKYFVGTYQFKLVDNFQQLLAFSLILKIDRTFTIQKIERIMDLTDNLVFSGTWNIRLKGVTSVEDDYWKQCLVVLKFDQHNNNVYYTMSDLVLRFTKNEYLQTTVAMPEFYKQPFPLTKITPINE